MDSANGTVKTVTLAVRKECKGSVRFECAEDMSAEFPVTNVYVSREMPGVNSAKYVRVTVEVVS